RGAPDTDRLRSARDGRGARNSEPIHTGIAALAEEERRENECDDAHGDVHSEDPLPAERVGEDPAEQDTRSSPEAADGAPDPERDVALPSLLERHRENRERRRRDDRSAETLERACGDQGRLGPRLAGEERRDREYHDAEEEDAAPPEQVG